MLTLRKIEKFFTDLVPKPRDYVTEECKTELTDALLGKTIEKVVQVPIRDGWFIIYLKATDGTAVHLVSCAPALDGCIRVQIDKPDGTKLHLPVLGDKK